jgi:hypothetical protein
LPSRYFAGAGALLPWISGSVIKLFVAGVDGS